MVISVFPTVTFLRKSILSEVALNALIKFETLTIKREKKCSICNHQLEFEKPPCMSAASCALSSCRDFF